VYLQEKAWKNKRELTKEKGKGMYGHVVVMDLEGLGWKHIYPSALSLFKSILQLDQDNYPETLKCYYAINSPTIVHAIYRMIKPCLDKRTLDKVNILGSDYQQELLEIIDADCLPKEYGGTCECEGGCIAGTGGSYSDTKDDGTTHNPVEATVSRKSQHAVKVNVTEEQTVIAWEFMTEEYDIGFGVNYEETDGEVQTLIEVERCSSQEQKLEGHLVAEKTGTYVLIWDNSYSMFTKKILKYQVFLYRPEETETKDEKDDAPEEQHSKSDSDGD